MIDGTYKTKIDLPIGHADFTVALRTEGDTVFVEADAPIVGAISTEGALKDEGFVLEGSLKLKLLGTIDYTVDGKVEGDDLHMVAQTSKGEYILEGVRV